jgi:hypothetical protein
LAVNNVLQFVDLMLLPQMDLLGLYIATLFVVWQVINFLVFRMPPRLLVWLGGTLVVTGRPDPHVLAHRGA